MTADQRASVRHALRNDSGVSLVELIIVVVVVGIIGSLITMVFVNGLTSQQATAARDLATGRATVITETLADSVRNAVTIRVSSQGSRLDAVVLLPNNTFECRAWAVNRNAELVYSRGSSARTSNPDTWGPLAEKVSGALTGSPARAFASAGVNALDIGLRFSSPTTREETVITTRATAQAKTERTPPAC
ncbi:prepilin-type N-terminal cleavage/methylation domain-containing protein [Microbacterium keratanolyticum]|uniref:prepilin-type N-terminal cleavage/methylation domain-containing protein n=1 Tax=Microbacterium keratanolyticum TaxID=67574 RepID=UPI0036323DA6